MPLAHPTTATTSNNFGADPFLVVRFLTADPGEHFTDFTHRVEHPKQTIWGQRGDRDTRNELIFDPASASRLRELLDEFLNHSV